MYHYWSFHGIDALVSAGLGGGSLIYANVFIRKDEKWFVQEDLRDGGYEYWPVSRADLDPHYDRVESMIGLQRYPFDHEPYSKTPKTIAFKAAAEANGMEWFLPKLAVTFANEGRPPVPGEAIVEELENLHGRTRTTCQLCGECDVGCNYGAKNTLDYNYLTHAAHHGAELRTLCDVRRFEPREGGGYAVHYAALDDVEPAEDDGRPPPLTHAHLRPPRAQRRHAGHDQPAAAQPQRLPAAEPPPGHALLRQRRPAHAGASTPARWSTASPRRGSSIPATARSSPARRACPTRSTAARAAASTCRTPAIRSSWPGSCTSSPRPSRCGRGARPPMFLVKNWLQGSPDTDVSGYIADLLASRELSAGGLPLLGMGRDIPDGRMFLRNGRLDLDWNRKRSAEYFARLRTTSREFAHSLGGSSPTTRSGSCAA